MKIALVVLNYNDKKTTVEFVKKIEQYKVIDKIMLVDNCSTDNSFDEFLNLKSDKIDAIKTGENKGYAYGNNYGIKNLKEKYDYIIISNSDIKIEEKSIKKCIDIMEKDKKIGISAPTMYLKNGKLKKRHCWKERTFLRELINTSILLRILFYPIYKKGQYKLDFSKEYQEVDCITGSFLIFRELCLKEVNLFDENTFLYYEEDIICKKIKEKGYKIVNVNSASYIHTESKSISKELNLFQRKKILRKSQKYYLKKYQNIKKWQEILLKIVNFEHQIELILQNLICKN